MANDQPTTELPVVDGVADLAPTHSKTTRWRRWRLMTKSGWPPGPHAVSACAPRPLCCWPCWWRPAPFGAEQSPKSITIRRRSPPVAAHSGRGRPRRHGFGHGGHRERRERRHADGDGDLGDEGHRQISSVDPVSRGQGWAPQDHPKSVTRRPSWERQAAMASSRPPPSPLPKRG